MPRRIVVMAHPRAPIIPQLRAAMSLASALSQDRTGVTLRPASRTNKNGAIACARSEEHTSELHSLMRTAYAVFCLNKKNDEINNPIVLTNTHHYNTTVID